MTTQVSCVPSLEELDVLFSDFTFESVLEEGEGFVSCLATSLSADQKVVVQLFPRGFGKKDQLKEPFIAEATKLVQLSHPNLVKVEDFGEVNEMPYLITSEFPEQSLREAVAGSQVDEANAARMVRGLLAGLQLGHEQGLVHGHLCPELIYLDQEIGEVKFRNLGLSISALRSGGKKPDSLASPYAAPEALVGKYDARSDVYAAGVILYELLTGRLLSQPYKHPSGISDCDVRFDNIMKRALQPDPSQRYQSAAELALDLRFEQGGVPTATSGQTNFSYAIDQPTAPTGPVLPLKSAQGGGAGTKFLIGGIVTLILGGAGFMALRPKAEPSDVIVSAEEKVATAEEIKIAKIAEVARTAMAQATEERVKEADAPKPVKKPVLAAGTQAAPDTRDALVASESFRIGISNGFYKANSPALDATSSTKGFREPWKIAEERLDGTGTLISGQSLRYPDERYTPARGGRLVMLNQSRGAKRTRFYRLLTEPVTSQSNSPVYISFLMQTGLDNAWGYRAFELHQGGIKNKPNRKFKLGFHNNDFKSEDKLWGCEVCNLADSPNKRFHVGMNSGKTTLFVVKFDLSQSPGKDQITVWTNPSLADGNDPKGGQSLAGINIVFDRISVAMLGSAKQASWDELRIGKSFLDVTTGGY